MASREDCKLGDKGWHPTDSSTEVTPYQATTKTNRQHPKGLSRLGTKDNKKETTFTTDIDWNNDKNEVSALECLQEG